MSIGDAVSSEHSAASTHFGIAYEFEFVSEGAFHTFGRGKACGVIGLSSLYVERIDGFKIHAYGRRRGIRTSLSGNKRKGGSHAERDCPDGRQRHEKLRAYKIMSSIAMARY